MSECTLHVGESVTLYARYADGTIPQNLAWLSSPETALNLSYIGNTCDGGARLMLRRRALL